MKRPNLTGTWFNDSHCAILPTSDYAYIERNRTICKVARVAYSGLAPLINGPLELNSDGTLTTGTINTLKGAIVANLRNMLQNGEISGNPNDVYKMVYIDPTQNVLSTSTVKVILRIVPVGVARSIQVTLGFTTSL